MRPLLVAFALALLGLCSGCSPTVVGAACHADTNCPSDQRCRRGICELGSRTGTGSGTAGSSGSSGSSGCPALGTRVDDGCPVLGATACAPSGDGLLDCEAVALPAPSHGTCGLWRPLESCADAGLRCVPGEPACSCPPAPGGNVLYVDARSASSKPAPSGVASPSACAFHTIGDAMQEVARRSAPSATVILQGGAIPRAWQPRHRYQTGDLVTPDVLDGFTYVATVPNGAVTGDVQPNFTGGTTPDANGISWSRGAPIAPQTYGSEPAPTIFPAGVTLTTAECVAADAGPLFGCDPRGYLYASPGFLLGGDALVTLSDRDVLRGLTITNLGSSDVGDALHCTDGGSIALDHVGLDGSNSTLRLAHGAALSGCNASLSRLATSGFRLGSVRIEAPARAVNIDRAALGDLTSPNGIGLDVIAGTVTVANSIAFLSGSDGIRVQADAARHGAIDLSLQNVRLIGNRHAGMVVGSFSADGGPQPVSISLNQVDLGRNNGRNAATGGGLVFTDPVALVQADGVHAHDNGAAQILFGPNATPQPLLDGGAGVWNLGHASIDISDNAVFCYAGRGDKGIVDQAGGSAGVVQVNAEAMYWDNPVPVSGTDYVQGPLGQIDASSYLGRFDAGPICPGPI